MNWFLIFGTNISQPAKAASEKYFLYSTGWGFSGIFKSTDVNYAKEDKCAFEHNTRLRS
tara:strand:- start:210 stop:386 length:177 start_codon:yes stop_codon:yes gene_type:complete